MSQLLEKKAAFTVNLILDSACELLETEDVSELSFKKVSEQAEISQRTMFRYFRTREAFLDALTKRLYEELGLPEIPEKVEYLQDYIATLYEKLEAQPRKVIVLLSADLLPRVLGSTAIERFKSLQLLLAKTFPQASTDEVTITAANLRYVMSASSWRYYRMHFNFDAKMATECAQLLVRQSLNYLAQN